MTEQLPQSNNSPQAGFDNYPQARSAPGPLIGGDPAEPRTLGELKSPSPTPSTTGLPVLARLCRSRMLVWALTRRESVCLDVVIQFSLDLDRRWFFLTDWAAAAQAAGSAVKQTRETFENLVTRGALERIERDIGSFYAFQPDAKMTERAGASTCHPALERLYDGAMNAPDADEKGQRFLPLLDDVESELKEAFVDVVDNERLKRKLPASDRHELPASGGQSLPVSDRQHTAAALNTENSRLKTPPPSPRAESQPHLRPESLEKYRRRFDRQAERQHLWDSLVLEVTKAGLCPPPQRFVEFANWWCRQIAQQPAAVHEAAAEHKHRRIAGNPASEPGAWIGSVVRGYLQAKCSGGRVNFGR